MNYFNPKELNTDDGKKYLYVLTIYSKKPALFKARKTIRVGYVTSSKAIHIERDTFIDRLDDGTVFSLTQVKNVKCAGSMDKLERVDKPIDGSVIRIERDPK